MTHGYKALPILIVLSVGAYLRADMVVSTTPNAGWQPFVPPDQHAQGGGLDPGNQTTYFDGRSYDGPNANIVYFLEGQGFFAGDPQSPNVQLPYWGLPGGGPNDADLSFYFNSGGLPQVANFLLFSAMWAPLDSVGWYNPANLSDWGWILKANGQNPTPHSVEFTPSTTFGLFFVPDLANPPFVPGGSTPGYYTESAMNGVVSDDQMIGADPSLENNYQHFAVFDDGEGGFYFGIKDRSLQPIGTDHDYNDMVFRLDPVPEPGLLAPIAGLLVGLLALRRRQQRL